MFGFEKKVPISEYNEKFLQGLKFKLVNDSFYSSWAEDSKEILVNSFGSQVKKVQVVSKVTLEEREVIKDNLLDFYNFKLTKDLIRVTYLSGSILYFDHNDKGYSVTQLNNEETINYFKDRYKGPISTTPEFYKLVEMLEETKIAKVYGATNILGLTKNQFRKRARQEIRSWINSSTVQKLYLINTANGPYVNELSRNDLKYTDQMLDNIGALCTRWTIWYIKKEFYKETEIYLACSFLSIH